MKYHQYNLMPWLASLALAVFAAVTSARAGTVTTSTNAPVVDGNDIANYGGITGSDKWWIGAYPGEPLEHVSPKGQTFLTGDGAVRLKAITYQTSAATLPYKDFAVRVGTVSGTNFTVVHSETMTQSNTWPAGSFVTWTFATPILLNGSTTYGVDVGMISSTLGWATAGIPYLNMTANEYPLGASYTSGTGGWGIGDNALRPTTSDRVFHLDIEPPLDGGFNFVAGNPPDDATAALVRPELVATFSQNLVAGTGNITILNLTDATNMVIAVGDPSVTLTNNLLKIQTAGRITWGKSYAIQIDAGAIKDQSNNPFAGILDNTTWNFVTSAEDPLVGAFIALKNHINGSAPLDAAQIEAHKVTIDQNLNRFPESAATITNALELVRTYDTVLGPLWVARSLPQRAYVVNDIHWTIYVVMQNILETIYTPVTLAAHEARLNGFKFNSSSNFPGACAPPANPVNIHTAIISANYLDTRGPATQGDGPGTYGRKPTGTYLAPGTIATVTVPAALVNKGYKIRIGAHSWDFSNRPNMPRLDRSTVLYNITSTQTKVASPLGGGIYIEVPFLASNGIVNVDITGAVRSPYFSAKSFHQTSPAQWLIERTNAAPWADFQSDKFMMQVPRSWIYAMPDPTQLMADHDKAMDALNDLMGFPHLRGKETMYPQVDLQLRASVYAPGYPSVNNSYSPTTDYGGYLNNYLVRGPQDAPDYYFHEQGHAYFFPKFGGESESAVNLHHVAVLNQKFGKSLDEAFRTSRGFTGSFFTLDTAAIAWMCSFNFSPRDQPMAQGEKSYYLKGHAKFVDIAKLYGWGVLSNFWGSMVTDVENGNPIPATDDDKLFRLCQAVGKDVRPLFHFWGIHPQNPTNLAAAIANANIPADTNILNRLSYYKTIVPTNNADFRRFATNWWGHKPLITGFWEETDHAMQWDATEDADPGNDPNVRPNGSIYVEASAADIIDRIQEIALIYFPGPVTPNPMRFAVPPSGVDPTTIGMAATNATAVVGPVEYYFENVTNGNFRTWGTSPLWNETGLTTGVPYGYRVRARDGASNYTDWSAVAVAIPETDVKFPVPNPMKFAIVPRATNETTITMAAVTALDASGVEYYFENLTAPGHSSGWQDSPVYTDINLTPKTQYTYRVRARDKSPAQNTTTNSASFWATTDFTLPTPNPMTWATPPTAVSSHWITMTATTASDTSGVEYYFENLTVPGRNSGWQNSPTYIDTGLTPNTEYSYQVKARDKSLNGNETDVSPTASATTLNSAVSEIFTWDNDGLVPGQKDGAGVWLGANLWWNGTANTNWVSGADAAFGNGGSGGAVTLASPTTLNTLTMGYYSGTYTLGSAGQPITLSNGIAKTSSSGALMFASPVVLAAPQTWANVSANALVTGNGTNLMDNNGNPLTIDGTGNMTFGVINNDTPSLTGAGNLIKNGTGTLSLGGTNSGFTGNVTVNGGVLRVTKPASITGNLNLAGGVYEHYWSDAYTRTLGTGAGQMQITGGVSGLSENGNTGMTFTFNNSAAFELVWGTSLFNPATFMLQADTAQVNSSLTLANKINLNGADRTIQVSGGTTGGASATLSGVITNSTGTAGLIKTGAGRLNLNAANTYNGGTTLQAGAIQLGNNSGLGSTNGALTVHGGLLNLNNSTVTVGNLAGTGGTIANNGNTNKTLTIGAGNATGGNYQGLIVNNTNAGVGTLALTKTGTGTLTLSGANAYSGLTTVSAGKLFINGDQTAAIGSVNVSSNATLGGTGTLGGDTTVSDAGGLEFNLSTVAASHDKLELAAGKTLNFSGASTLTITSTAGASPGTYVLMTAPGGISGVAPATVNLPVGWSAAAPAIVGNDLVIQITSTGGPATLSPARLTNSVSGSTLSLSWPAGQGWRLQEQTNSRSVGLRTNWVYVTDASVNSTNITVDKTKPTTFYRLLYP